MEMRYVRFVLFSVCLLSCRLAFAESPQDLFKRANAAYAEGKFQDAAALYESASKGGLSHWALFYNLGNSFYKSGQLGKAIANYERSFRLHSSDSDVLNSLQLASVKAGDPVMPAGSLAALLWRLFYYFSLNALTLVASMLFLLLSGVAVMALLKKPLLSLEGSLLGLLLFGLMAGWAAARAYLVEQPIGVVVASVAEVRSGPNLSYPANFTVPEGHRVPILQEQESITGWVEIGVPEQGVKGWVPVSVMEAL